MNAPADPRSEGGTDVVLVPERLDLAIATGADRVAFLHRLMTADIAGCRVGHACGTLLLDIKGHVVADAHVWVLADEVRLIVAAGQGKTLVDALTRYAVMDDFAVRLSDVTSMSILGSPAI